MTDRPAKPDRPAKLGPKGPVPQGQAPAIQGAAPLPPAGGAPMLVAAARPATPKPAVSASVTPLRAEPARPRAVESGPKAVPPMPLSDPPHQPHAAHDSGLVVRSLMKRFKKRPVLRGVSVSLRRGEAVGLLGPNGAGKTTCFYIITGLVRPDAGTIELDGYDVTGLPMYRRARLGIGYLPQEASIFRGMTVEQNIRSVLEIVEPERSRREARLDELLDEFSIAHLRKAPALALSGGERRRCEIARALASQPAFMLLDEPLAGIDPIAVGDIRDLVSHLKDRGIGVLITDHNVRETLEIVDRAYILHEGQVLREGTPSEIVEDVDVRRVYLGERFSL
jgi:lipopolysaccharide export system ATP-binding protein